MPKIRILIVEDERLYRGSVSEYLEAAGNYEGFVISNTGKAVPIDKTEIFSRLKKEMQRTVCVLA